MPKFTQQDHIQFLLSWPKKKLHDEKSFEELLRVDDIPLWFFVRTLFDPTLIPPLLNFYGSLENQFSPYHQLKATAASRLGPQLLINRQKKIFHAFREKSTSIEERDVFFLSYSNHIMHDGSLFRIQGLVNALEESKTMSQGKYFVDPLMRKAYGKLFDLNTPYPFMTEKQIENAQKKAQKLYAAFRAISREELERVMKTERTHYYPALKYVMRFYFSVPFLTLILLYYEVFQTILQKGKYKIVVLNGIEGLFERALICACKKLNIPCVLLQHGFGNRAYYPEELEGITQYFVFGKSHQQEHIDLGCDPSKLTVVGSLILSELEPFLEKKPATTHHLLLTSPFVEQGMIPPHTYFARIKKIFQSAKKSSLPLIVKLHPREEHLDRYLKLAQEIDPRIKVFKDISRDAYYQYLNDCSCFLSFGSTSQIEAMFLKKPMVTVDICGLSHTTLASPQLGEVGMWNDPLDEKIDKSVKNYVHVCEHQQDFLRQQIRAIGKEANSLALDTLLQMVKNTKTKK